jgi:hypothetical protein
VSDIQLLGVEVEAAIAVPRRAQVAKGTILRLFLV